MMPLERAARWREMGRKKFSVIEDAVVREMAPMYSMAEIGGVLGRAPTSIQSACRRLGIRTNGGRGGWPSHKRNQTVQENA